MTITEKLNLHAEGAFDDMEIGDDDNGRGHIVAKPECSRAHNETGSSDFATLAKCDGSTLFVQFA